MKNSNKKSQQNKNNIKRNTLTIFKNKNDFILPIILAFCLPVLLYLQTINFGFSYFDDDLIIINNINFLSHFGNFHQAFLTDQFIDKSSSFYRPMGTLSYMIDIQLSGGNNAWMYHLSNILFLGLISCLIFLLLKRLLVPPKLALISTLIYCVHPLFVSTTVFIPNRAELMLDFFSLLSFLFFIDFLQMKKISYLFLNWAAFTLALFSKETGAFLPFIFITYYFTFSKEKRFDKKYLFMIVLYAISGMYWYWLRSKAIVNFSNSGEVFGLPALLSNLRIIPEALTKFFLPFDFAPIPGFSIMKFLIGVVIIILIIIIFSKNKERSKKEKVFCFSWFIILMLPPMLYKHPYIDYLDHRFFLPLFGILLFLLFIFPKKWLKKGDIKISWIMIAIIIFLCSFTFIKSRDYSDPMTFYNSVISYNSNSALAFNNRGKIKSNKGEYEDALKDFNRAIDISRSYDKPYNNRGLIKSKMGDYIGAIADFDIAISINNIYANAYSNRGAAKIFLGKYKESIVDFNQTIALQSDCEEAYYNRGFAKIRLEDYKDAIEDFNKYISFNSTNAKAYGNRAIAKYSIKDYTGAIEDFNKALELNPNDKTALRLKDKAQQELQKTNK